MTKNKAMNRFQAWKHKEKAKRRIRDIWHRPAQAGDKRFVGIEAGVHGVRCSCPMCRTSRNNPLAKTGRLPVSERRRLRDALEQLEG